MDLGFIEFALGIAIIIFASAYAKHRFPSNRGVRVFQAQPQAPAKPVRTKPSPASLKALETYERLAKEKMDVIKTALAMGYRDEDLARLDARLESLIGREKLEEIVSGREVIPNADLLDTRLDSEISRLKSQREG